MLTPRQFFLFCPRCGQPYSSPEHLLAAGEHQRCSGCGTTVFHNPHPAVAAVPVHGRKALLARRALEPAKGLIDTFGGFLEWGESPLDALMREFPEETGGAVFVPRCVTGIYHHYYPWDGLNISVITIVYLGLAEGEIHPADDVSEALWYPIASLVNSFEDLPEFQWAFPHLPRAMEDVWNSLAEENR